MKIVFASLLPLFVMLSVFSVKMGQKTPENHLKTLVMQQDSVLRHVVLFKFKKEATAKDIAQVEEAFSTLPAKISQIHSYEWGINNSPEGLEKGFTHCFLLTFKSEADRAIYLPHPDHKAFGDLLSPFLEDVLVVDYWTQ